MLRSVKRSLRATKGAIRTRSRMIAAPTIARAEQTDDDRRLESRLEEENPHSPADDIIHVHS